MTPLRQQMIAALQRSGTRERTQQSSGREVRLLAQFYGTSPHLISASELQQYVLHRTNVDHLAPTSRRICYSGLRCFSLHVLERAWKSLDLMRAQSEYRLPAILSGQEGRRLLSMATPLHNRVYCTTVSSGGLRLHAGLFLQVSDIDGQRLMVHVHRGKGAKDRDVPLSPKLLETLREYWRWAKPTNYLFPGQPGQRGTDVPLTTKAVWHACHGAAQRAGAAQWLIDEHYTTPERLAIEGGSNGGLLMGAALTQHKQLFRAVVSHVGIYDMLRVELQPNGAFNVTEFGTVKELDQFRALYGYSPYHHVEDGAQYPAVLFLTGANDPRVDPSHSRKMTARLQANGTKRLVLLRTTSEAGHGIGTALSEQIAQEADVMAFLFDQWKIAGPR